MDIYFTATDYTVYCMDIYFTTTDYTVYCIVEYRVDVLFDNKDQHDDCPKTSCVLPVRTEE